MFGNIVDLNIVYGNFVVWSGLLNPKGSYSHSYKNLFEKLLK